MSDKPMIKERELGEHARRSWTGIVYTAALLVLITTALHIDSVFMSVTVILSAAAVASVVHRCLPDSPILPLVFANAIGVYACVFIFAIEIFFPDVGDLAALGAFLLPLLGFTTGLLGHRDKIRRIAFSNKGGKLWHLPPLALMLVSIVAVQLEDFAPVFSTIALFGVAIGLGGLAYLASHRIAVFMTETGALFRDFFATIRSLIRPAYAFFTFYLLFVIVFACLYSIVDFASAPPHFSIQGELRDIGFLEAIYFSIVTF
ncbi:MAG: hypothetical protein ACR2QH_10325, partial [Geminicoccaceae bacterium]